MKNDSHERSGLKLPWRVVALIAGVLTGVALLAAFGGTASKAASSKQQGGKVLGVDILYQADEADQRILAGIKKQAAKYGWSVRVIDANLDPSKVQAAMSTFINQKVGGIITEFTDNSQLTNQFAAAAKAKIPVIAIAGGDPVANLASNLPAPEKQGAADLAKAFYAQIKGNGPVVEMVLPEATPCLHRVQGFDSIAKQHPANKVTVYHINGANPAGDAQSFMASFLQGNPTTAGILSCWDVPMMGGLAAVRAKKLSPAFVGMGINGTSDAVHALQKGDPYVDGELAFAWGLAGYNAVERLHTLFAGGKVPANTPVTYGVFTAKHHPPYPQLEFSNWLPKGWSPDYFKAQ